jgi:hypothetical protein
MEEIHPTLFKWGKMTGNVQMWEVSKHITISNNNNYNTNNNNNNNNNADPSAGIAGSNPAVDMDVYV